MVAQVGNAIGAFINGECWENYKRNISYTRMGEIAVAVCLLALAAGIVGSFVSGVGLGIVLGTVVPLGYFIYATDLSMAEKGKGKAGKALNVAAELFSSPISEEDNAKNIIARGLSQLGMGIAHLIREAAKPAK
jgi:hypothetical protein